MTAGPATLTARPLARNRPVPIAPPSAIIACWAVESWRASTCSLRTAAGCSVRGMSLTSGSVSAIARPPTRSGYPLLLWAPKGARRSALSALGGRGLLADLEPARPRHGGEVDVAVETDRDVVEDQVADEPDLAGARFVVGAGDVTQLRDEADAELGAAARLREFDQDVAAVHRGFALRRRGLGAEAGDDGLFLRQFLDQFIHGRASLEVVETAGPASRRRASRLQGPRVGIRTTLTGRLYVVRPQGRDEIRVLRGTGDAVERAGEGAACRDSLRGGSPRSPAGYRGIGSASVASSRRYHTRIASARRIDARP